MTTRSAPTILYTTADASPQSGAFHSLLKMSREIGSRGFRSVLALPRQTVPASPDSAPDPLCYLLPLPRVQRGKAPGSYLGDVAMTARSVAELRTIIRRERVNVVHINEILDVYGALAARAAGVPIVWHLRADLSSAPSPLRAALPVVMTTLATQIVAVSASARAETFTSPRAEHGKVTVLHNPGPDPKVFHPRVSGAAVRSDLDLDDGSFLVALVAKLGRRKGHDVLLRAAPKILSAFPTTRFLFVGGELDGTHHALYAERLRALPRALGVEGAVTFAGYRSDIAEIMAAADVVVHCSTYPDPFPGVVLQAMAVGTPVVASDLGGPREQVENGISGLLTRPGDTDALAGAICSLLGDRARRVAMGRASTRRVTTVFGDDTFYAHLSRVYRRAMSAHHQLAAPA
jgi:glycosyltransferase involved in cell wall biosynthesis